MSTRILLAGWLSAIAWLAPSAPAAPSAASPPGAGEGDFSEVYLTKEQALRHVFPDARRVVELRHLLTASQTRAIETLIGRRLDEGGFFLYAAWNRPDGDAPDAYAAVVAEVGKVRPITHIVEVRPVGADGRQGQAGRVAVMIYRETHGAEVASGRFMAQYAGKSLADPIRVDQDVIHIAGATLSAHAICRGVRKALAVVQVVLLDVPPDERAARLAAGSDVTPGAPDAAPSRASASDAGPEGGEIDTTSGDAGATGSAGPVVFARQRVMGTLADVTLPLDPAGSGPGRDALAAAAQAALDELARWDAILSDWRDDTPLSRLNAAPVGAPVALDPDLLAFLRHADGLVGATGGAFDPAVGALVDAWKLRTPEPTRPDPARLADAREASGWSGLALDPSAGTATRRSGGLRLDPGASGKGWALDRAADVLRARGVTRALLSFRSTLLALGAPPGAEGWVIPVHADGADRDFATVVLHDAALSVSGGLSAGFEDGETERGHAIDPRDGVPVPAARLAWVVARQAADADALSTALLVAGPELPAWRDAEGRPACGGFVADSLAASLAVAWPGGGPTIASSPVPADAPGAAPDAASIPAAAPRRTEGP